MAKINYLEAWAFTLRSDNSPDTTVVAKTYNDALEIYKVNT